MLKAFASGGPVFKMDSVLQSAMASGQSGYLEVGQCVQSEHHRRDDDEGDGDERHDLGKVPPPPRLTLAPREVCGFSNKSQRHFCILPRVPGRKNSGSSTCLEIRVGKRKKSSLLGNPIILY